MSATTKAIIVFICLVCSLVGFLIKIPVPLRGNDKVLHTAFYFIAAGFLHFLFRRWLVVIMIVLALFGVLIEYLQELSNKILHKRIHGRFDVEDIYANLKGLALYAVLAILIWAISKAARK